MTKTKMKRELQLIWEVMHSRFKMIETIQLHHPEHFIHLQGLAEFIDKDFDFHAIPMPGEPTHISVIVARKDAKVTQETIDEYTAIDNAMFELTRRKPDMMYVYGVLLDNNIITEEEIPEEFKGEVVL